ncbi:non-homologous end joining protein Ku [Amycolatopsis sp. CA-230715]|uniref:non-homologous end joining protein Ku n=1 Tax=Amycolatopsis sp. CA-230715 TaxID=2745196 RepID=UPI001C021D8A|nr:Ku protein [Amycolatopsis sp. CA-230715]QWF80098.1 Non-homologous end joining protein Ku [Amycolatopsis sp. CA-230715]
MARPIWSGSINFGLVTVPVALYSATEDHSIHFRQFERGTSDRIRYRRVNERTGKEVDYDKIVKGYELDDGEYVLVEPEELDEIAPGRSRTIDIESFVDLEEVDPIYFQRTYWLGPAKEEFHRAYALLLQAMAKTNRAGIARFVMRGKEYLAAVRAGDGVLTLNTMHFAADIRDPAKELKSLPELKARGKELDMAVSLVDSMTEQWQPDQYVDTYTERVKKLIDDKKAGRTVTPESEPSEPTKVVDLFEALSRSVEGRRKGGKRGKKKPDVSDLSKADLEKLAREQDVKGRSKMTRAELEKAVKAS